MINFNTEFAIKNNLFTLYYQPKIYLDTKEIIGAEALIRLKENGKIISPSRFLPAAEQNGDIVKIDKWVFKQIARDIKKIHEEARKTVPISFNVSALHFQQETLVEDLEGLLEKTRNYLPFLEIEITETSDMCNIDKAKMDIAYLRERGFRISVDDFGTGYGSLIYVYNFPIDTIKIDRLFVDKLATSERSLSILKILMKLCNKLNIKTIAEGVEKIEQANKLRGLGCNIVQGFYYAKPMPLYDFIQFLSVSNVFSFLSPETFDTTLAESISALTA